MQADALPSELPGKGSNSLYCLKEPYNCSSILLAICTPVDRASQVVLVMKNLPDNAGDIKMLVLGLERSPRGRAWQPTPVLALRILWTEKPGGLQSMGLDKELDMTKVT